MAWITLLDSYATVVLNGEVYAQIVHYKSCEMVTNGVKRGQCVQKSFHGWEKIT